LLARLQQEHVHDVLHAGLDLILDLYELIYAQHFLRLVGLNELAEFFEELKEVALEFLDFFSFLLL